MSSSIDPSRVRESGLCGDALEKFGVMRVELLLWGRTLAARSRDRPIAVKQVSTASAMSLTGCGGLWLLLNPRTDSRHELKTRLSETFAPQGVVRRSLISSV